jgi:WD40 repeat protein
LTPDGKRLLTASHDGMIRVWDANTGEAGPAFDWDIGAVTAVAFSPDGLTCAAAGLNGKVIIWDVDG